MTNITPNNNSKLRISELDFDTIKGSLQSYLQGQTEFSDYNFAGSGLQVILNLLAYNTTYLAYYLSLIANEMYLDSADKRASIVSIASELGYVPYSRNSTTAVINLVITPPSNISNPAFFTLPKNTKFTTSVNNKIYTFNTIETVTVPLIAGKYSISNLTLREGTALSFKWVVNEAYPQRYIIPNSNVDTDTITVRVQDNTDSTNITVYTHSSNVLQLNKNSKVYFLREVDSMKYEIYFGDNILGTQLTDGNIVIVEYLNCSAGESNFASTFSLASSIGYSNISINIVNAGYGGAEREDNESIRFSAPQNYQTQNRAVTIDDYKTIIANEYPNVDSVAVWGGQDEIPIQPGKVFLSLKPVSGYVITENTKQTIVKEILAKKNIVSIIPVIIDPDYIFVSVNSIVKYNPDSTILTSDAIKNNVITTIQNFAATNINKFDRVLRYSQMTTAIDGADSSITNNLTVLSLEKKFTPILNVSGNYTLKFSNAIVPFSFSSNGFIDTADSSFVRGDIYFFDDDGLGNIRTVKYVGSTKKYTRVKSGSIDYLTGIISLTKFTPSSILDAYTLSLFCSPKLNDIVPLRNNIIVIDPNDILIAVLENTPIQL